MSVFAVRAGLFRRLVGSLLSSMVLIHLIDTF